MNGVGGLVIPILFDIVLVLGLMEFDCRFASWDMWTRASSLLPFFFLTFSGCFCLACHGL
jgi:hypothetical protein